jgi:DNA-binding winged helix-turn-helix (wHTH) protein
MSASCCPLAFREWFGLTPAAAEILASLYAAKGETVTPEALAREAGVSPRAIGFHLFSVRQALDCEGLDHEPGRGYRLSEIGLEECRAALRTLAEELRAAG